MFELKIVITVIVAFLLLAGFLSSSPSVAGFFEYVNERIGSISGAATSRDVDFSISTDSYGDVSFSAIDPVNFTIVGFTTAALKSGNLVTNKSLSVYNFQGTGSIQGNTLILDGRISKLELPEIAVAVQETIDSNSTFTNLAASGLEINEIKILSTSGTLDVRNASTRFTGDVYITAPKGYFEFNNSRFYINGKAAKIGIPSAGINID